MSSFRDPLEDLRVMAEFLLSPDYVVETLSREHGIGVDDAARRAVRIAPHVRTALAYLDQTFSGPPHVAFLPGYYALLNLVKVYSLIGPYHSSLNQNRWHGAAYDVYKKASQSLRTEEITLHEKGAISLFYQSITGNAIRKKLILKMVDVYPYIQDVGVEWNAAAGWMRSADEMLDRSGHAADAAEYRKHLGRGNAKTGAMAD